MPVQTTSDSYTPLTGLVYVFNLIVGTGALTMPAAFAHAGWIMSLIIVILLCIVSYVTTTFVIETMSVANAVIKSKTTPKVTHSKIYEVDSHSQLQGNVCESSTNSAERVPLLECTSDTDEVPSQELFDITQRVEMGAMADLFFNKIGVKLFYVCIAVYLYGDLAIYAAAIAKSMRDVTCVDRRNAYRIYLAVVLLAIGPFCFFNLQKTKYLQLLTTFFRWIAFISMITLAIIKLTHGQNLGKPAPVTIHGVPNLFGVCVYSFMCHHSLPGLITPINRKKNLYWLIFTDYSLILIFYSLLSFTGIFAFDSLQDIYTLNFQYNKCAKDSDSVTQVPFMDYFLPLFPVFTLSTNFPIIAITLTNNLRTLFLPKDNAHAETMTMYNRKEFLIQRIVFPVLAIAPPFAVAFATESLQILVGFVGSYAGAAIQYIVPAMLVYFARKTSNELYPSDHQSSSSVSSVNKNPFSSPFHHKWWIWIVMTWSVICIIFVTVDHIIS